MGAPDICYKFKVTITENKKIQVHVLILLLLLLLLFNNFFIRLPFLSFQRDAKKFDHTYKFSSIRGYSFQINQLNAN